MTYRVMIAGCIGVRQIVEVEASSPDEAKNAALTAAHSDGFDWGLDDVVGDIEAGTIEVEPRRYGSSFEVEHVAEKKQ